MSSVIAPTRIPVTPVSRPGYGEAVPDGNNAPLESGERDSTIDLTNADDLPNLLQVDAVVHQLNPLPNISISAPSGQNFSSRLYTTSSRRETTTA
jgi:hypothetical protein